ncbi:MAG: hypothetical protein J3R72DRAFT_458896 [Linnemannia gamsii]|nr:MAG: hypothetical protein J3R72DRAFT_458896 [Linnemannia gamsii]
MEFSFLAVVAASLIILNLTQAGKSITFVACKHHLCQKNVCKRYFYLQVGPIGARTLRHGLVLPGQTATICHASGFWCVKHDMGHENVSVQYAHVWHKYKKGNAAKTWSGQGFVCEEYWDKY